jgi:Mg-chelatase subunit ChlD
MFRHCTLLTACAGLLAFAPAVRADEPAKPKKPKVEVVFVLDTTGSMGGLLEGAKKRIWSICNQIANGKPTPDLKVGLVAFRDKGDAYITKVFDLTDDLDTVYGHLKEFKAQGGGDIPESVNQALDDAVNKIKWSSDDKTLRIIFLVGDAPPHMDYTDDVKYPVTCQKACKKGIIINTVQCGNDPECTKYWKDICRLAEGSFVQIPQDGGVRQVVSTPFDARLAEINTELARSTLVYGSREMKADGRAKNEAAEKLAPAEAAPRAGFQAKNAQAAAYDLLDSVKQNKVKLEGLKKEELPEVMQKMTLEEQKKFLDEIDAKRTALCKEAVDLDKKRTEFIAKKQAELSGKKDSFDDQVLEILRKQARKGNIEY